MSGPTTSSSSSSPTSISKRRGPCYPSRVD
jgi:hypothetical protein